MDNNNDLFFSKEVEIWGLHVLSRSHWRPKGVIWGSKRRPFLIYRNYSRFMTSFSQKAETLDSNILWRFHWRPVIDCIIDCRDSNVLSKFHWYSKSVNEESEWVPVWPWKDIRISFFGFLRKTGYESTIMSIYEKRSPLRRHFLGASGTWKEHENLIFHLSEKKMLWIDYNDDIWEKVPTQPPS